MGLDSPEKLLQRTRQLFTEWPKKPYSPQIKRNPRGFSRETGLNPLQINRLSELPKKEAKRGNRAFSAILARKNGH